MEIIPKEFKDYEHLNKEKQPKIVDLTKVDMKCGATFIAEEIGLELWLVAKRGVLNPASGMWDDEPGTALRVKFKGGHLLVENKRLLEIVMKTEAYANGNFRIDPEDPTGIWRQLGMLETREVVTVVPESVQAPGFADIDFTALTKEEEVVPLVRV